MNLSKPVLQGIFLVLESFFSIIMYVVRNNRNHEPLFHMQLRSFILALILTASSNLYSQKLTVVVNGVKSSKGTVLVALYNSNRTFMLQPFLTAEVKAKEGHVMVVFPNVPEGEYAVTVLHDLNGNKKMDENLLGIPKEGFGFSNDAMGAFGPPSFRECVFPMHPGPITTGVRLRHF